MVWNHRICRHRATSALEHEEALSIHEVYYPDPGSAPDGVTLDPVPVAGENIEELRNTLNRMLRCLEKPVLEFEEISLQTRMRGKVDDRAE